MARVYAQGQKRGHVWWPTRDASSRRFCWLAFGLAKASRRQDQAGLGAADVAECKRMLRALPVARAVAMGDVVIRGQSRAALAKHDGGCHCGSKKETVRHFL